MPGNRRLRQLTSTASHGKRSAVQKAADVLRAVDGHRARSLTAISKTTGLPLSTTYRIANELVKSDLLRRSGAGYYSLQDLASRLAGKPDRIRGNGQLPPDATAVLDDLVAVTDRTVRFGWCRGDRMTCIERVPHQSLLKPSEQIDQRPLHASAMGKVLLAFATRPDLDDALKRPLEGYTADTITDLDELLGQLAQIRRTLVAHEFGEFDQHTSTIAVPVFGGGQSAVAALELRATGEPDIRRLEYALQLAARVLRQPLLSNGWRDNLDRSASEDLESVSSSGNPSE